MRIPWCFDESIVDGYFVTELMGFVFVGLRYKSTSSVSIYFPFVLTSYVRHSHFQSVPAKSHLTTSASLPSEYRPHPYDLSKHHSSPRGSKVQLKYCHSAVSFGS